MQNSARSKIVLGLLASACVPVLGMATSAQAQDATTTQTPPQDPQADQGQTSPEVKQSGKPADTSTSNQTPAPTTEQPTATGEDIIVTAQFRAQRLQDTPLSITAVNA